MGRFKRFEDIIAWQEARKLAVMVYNDFGGITDLDFRSQIRRAVISVSNNIAEGFSYGQQKDFKRFLRYAYASATEVKSMCYIALDLGYLDENELGKFLNACNRVCFLIFQLRNSLGGGSGEGGGS